MFSTHELILPLYDFNALITSSAVNSSICLLTFRRFVVMLMSLIGEWLDLRVSTLYLKKLASVFAIFLLSVIMSLFDLMCSIGDLMFLPCRCLTKSQNELVLGDLHLLSMAICLSLFIALLSLVVSCLDLSKSFMSLFLLYAL